MGQFDETVNPECLVCQSMCPEAVDGTLTPAEQAAFDKHVAGCVSCQLELEDAQRGAAWLTMLKGNTPEPPAGLMAKILAETTGATAFGMEADNLYTRPRAQAPKQTWLAAVWARTADAFRINTASAGFQPRFAMTAAMAFFSVALSLNMMGVRLRDLGHLNLRPGNISRTVADVSASASRSFQNMRVVYQLESRVSELRRDEAPLGDRDITPQPRQQQQQPDNQQPTDNKQPTRPRGSSELILPPAAGTRAHGTVRGEV